MAKALDLQLVAEGVETPRQLAWLQAQGVTAGQGFFFIEAVSASDFRAYISSFQPSQVDDSH
jgi:sensor c-di-GMP phosphodiesterase-like protein